MTMLKTHGMRAWTVLAALAIVMSLALSAPVLSQPAGAIRTVPPLPQQPSPEEQYRALTNANTITVLGASLSGAYIKIVEDIAKAVSDGENLRVLPVVGDGGSQNIRDLLYLRGVDAGIVMSTSMDIYRGKPLYGDLPAKLQYIARLYDEEFHIVGGTGLASVADLNGRKVGFHGGAFVSGQELLAKLKVKPSDAVQVDFFKGLDLVRTGDLAAIVRATASPMQELDTRFDPAVHRLVPIPFPDDLIDSYVPGGLTHKNYPRIVPEGTTVPTVAVGVVLATYAWQPGTERYRRVARFTEAFFANIAKLMADKNRHPKWDDVNLAAILPGWQRFPAAQDWLTRNGYPAPAPAVVKAPPATLSASTQRKPVPVAPAAKVKPRPQPLSQHLP